MKLNKSALGLDRQLVGFLCSTNAPVDEILGHIILINFLKMIICCDGTVTSWQEDLGRVFLGISDNQQKSWTDFSCDSLSADNRIEIEIVLHHVASTNYFTRSIVV